MQPLYSDEYRILSRLVSTQPLDPQARLRYGSSEGFSEPTSWFIRIKKNFLPTISAIKIKTSVFGSDCTAGKKDIPSQCLKRSNSCLEII